MHSHLRVGHTHRLRYVVPPDKLVPHLLPELPEFAGGQPVLATGFMVGLLEAPCMAALAGVLDQGETTVGTRVDIVHVAATLPEAVLAVDAVVSRVRRRYYEFDVVAVDELGTVAARGTIGQRVVTVAQFQALWPHQHPETGPAEVITSELPTRPARPAPANLPPRKKVTHHQ